MKVHSSWLQSIKISIQHIVRAVPESAIIAMVRALHYLVIDAWVRLFLLGNFVASETGVGSRSESYQKEQQHDRTDHFKIKWVKKVPFGPSLHPLPSNFISWSVLSCES